MARENFANSLLRSVALTLCTLILVVAVIGGGVYLALNKSAKVEKGSWLVLDLYGDVTEYATPGGPLGEVLGGDGLTLQDLLDNLGKAAVDDRIEGVIFKISSSNNAGWAKLEELRLAVDKVQAAGKPVHAWGDALDLRALYLASGCDDILMPAGGYCEFKGVAGERPFVRGVLDKLGIVPHLHQIKDYKSAAEMITRKDLSPAAREMANWMLEDYWAVIMPTLAAERGLTEARLVELMEYAEFEPSEAVEAGLIDEVVYLQELEGRLKGEKDDLLKTVSHADYAEVSWQDAGLKTGDTIAVVHAQGNIGGRENRIDPLMGVMMGHETIIAELRRCRLDDKVKAVVLRVDSGGGESLASDLMAHEVDVLAQVKPVVVSMVDVAASGGYYISYKGTQLVADNLTVTGSVGSINGFFNMKGFYDKIGMTKDFVSKGPMARLGTDYRDPTPEEWARHTDAHWKGFNAWLRDVADRRGMTFEHAETLAHGRIWTGRQALGNGLIDAVGNLDTAIALAVELAEADATRPPKVIHLPERQGLLASLTGGGPAADDPVASAVRSLVWRELRSQVRETGSFLEQGAANVVR